MNWRKSSRSVNTHTCIELSSTLTHLRDTKNRTGPTLRGDVVALVRAVKADQVGR